jgi:hypothetical protein
MNRAALLPAGLFVASLALFLWSPNHQMTDSGYALLVSENLLLHGDLDLARYQLEKDGPPNYRLAHVGARVVYSFPEASSILSVPYVAVARLAGSAIVAPDGRYATTVEKANQARLAALLMAAFAVIVFQTARLLLPIGPSLAIAIVTAFGTQVYSTASRTLWSHDWALVLVGGAIYLLARAAARAEGHRPFWLGTLAAWAYLIRPTAGLTLAGTAVYLFVVERRAAWRFAATVALWLAAFAADSIVRFGAALPPYFRDRLSVPSAEALAGTLVSPSRGVLVCVPAALAVILIGLRYRATVRFVPLLRLAVGICGAHWLVISGFDKWWGGHCFGSRLATELVPWLAVLAVLTIDGARQTRDATTMLGGRRSVVGLAIVLSATSVVVNAAGAISPRTVGWNVAPVNVDLAPGRLWSWRHAQVLAAIGDRAPWPGLPVPTN